jgi:cytochrome P450
MTPLVSADRPVSFDPLAGYADPYPIYARLRADSPVYYNEDRGLWALSRFEDVQRAARDIEAYTSTEGVDLDENTELYAPGAVVDLDPPDHTRLRSVLREDFTPRAVRAREPATRARVKSLVGQLLERGGGDFVQLVARPLPVWLLCDLLGFPIEDHPYLDQLYEGLQAREAGKLELPAQAWRARDEMAAYIDSAIEERERRAGSDLLSTMVAGEMTREELVSLCLFMFFAGINTTIGLLSYGIYWLAQFPEERDVLAKEPARMTAGVEELLRFDAPVQWTRRVTTRPVQLHDTTIPERASVLLLWGSANRDGRRYERSEELNVAREQKRHMAFGEGIHHCIGAPYARLEARLVLEELLSHAPRYEIAGPVGRLVAPGERILAQLPLAV